MHVYVYIIYMCVWVGVCVCVRVCVCLLKPVSRLHIPRLAYSTYYQLASVARLSSRIPSKSASLPHATHRHYLHIQGRKSAEELRGMAAGWRVPGYETMSREELAEVVGAIFKKSANLTAETAARIILQGIRDGSAVITVGEDAVVIGFLRRHCPELIYQDWFIEKVLGPWVGIAGHIGSPFGRFVYPTVVLGVASGLAYLVAQGVKSMRDYRSAS